MSLRVVARRVRMDNHPNRSDIHWLLFREGRIYEPLALLHDGEMDDLLADVREQRRNHEKEGT